MTVEVVITLESGKRLTLTHSEIAELRHALALADCVNGSVVENDECPVFDISKIPTFPATNGNKT